jgi:N-acetylmuramoyl-L-alanine amidase
MKIIIGFILLFSFITSAQTQQLTLTYGNSTYKIPVYERQGTPYISIMHLTQALSYPFDFNSRTDKLTVRFPNSTVIFTARNPFIVTVNKEGVQKVYQLPTSTYLLNNIIFIPLQYSVNLLESATGRSFKTDGKELLTVTDTPAPVIAEKPSVNKEETTPSSPLPPSVDITTLNIEEKANGTLVRIRSNKKAQSYTTSYKDGILTLRLRGVFTAPERISSIKGKGLIKEIRCRNAEPGTEIQFLLSQEYSTSEVIPVEGTNDLILSIHNKIFSRSEEKEKNISKWEFDVIVIDAGHGGKDAGAIAVNGAREKDINLAISLKLGKLIQSKMSDVKVVYTRSDDRFIELYKRGKIANDNGGKLFISIHCNSTPQKPSNASGFEVYLLRPGRTKEAIAIAERENSVIEYEDNPARYQKLTDENFILVSMAHSAYMKYSEKFSEMLANQFASNLPLPSRGVKQAGFYVLVGASMPGVLVETGFLSNKKDADYLNSAAGQQKIAESIFEGIKEFRSYYTNIIQAEI